MNETRYSRQEFIPRESFIFRWVLSGGGGGLKLKRGVGV